MLVPYQCIREKWNWLKIRQGESVWIDHKRFSIKEDWEHFQTTTRTTTTATTTITITSNLINSDLKKKDV